MDGFVDVKGYEGLYKINRLGDVMRYGRCLKSGLGSHGYKEVILCKDGKPKHYLIHRLIMLHFVPNPDNLPCVDHINRIKTDNRIENLRWCSIRDNSINQQSVEKRKGHIETMSYKRKDGRITTSYRLRYHLQGEYGLYKKSKSFKTLPEAQAFRNEIYGQ